MTTKVPQCLLLAGLLIFAFLVLKKHIVHDLSSGVVVIINTIGIVAGSALLSAAIFLALYGFFTAPTGQKQFLGWCFAGSSILLLMFLSYYIQYAYINWALNKYESGPGLLPDIVEHTRIDDSAGQREKWAHMAYMFYGVKLTYRQESGEWAYYNPTKKDESNYQDVKKINMSMKELRNSSRGLLNGDIDMVCTIFITFLFGLIWLAVKRLPVSKTSNLGM